jgi:hypothetical protein
MWVFFCSWARRYCAEAGSMTGMKISIATFLMLEGKPRKT